MTPFQTCQNRKGHRYASLLCDFALLCDTLLHKKIAHNLDNLRIKISAFHQTELHRKKDIFTHDAALQNEIAALHHV
eukprot:UN24934